MSLNIVLSAEGRGSCKVVHFVRHAQAVSNAAAAEQGHHAYKSEEYFDAELTLFGEQQARSLGKQEADALMQAQLVVCSPLSRAVQTATWMYATALEQAGVSARAPPIELVDLCREKLGTNPCDRRRTIAEIRAMHGGALERTFRRVSDEECSSGEGDAPWDAYGPAKREDAGSILKRANLFLDWLFCRPEFCITVVTHSAFLHHGIGPALHQARQTVFSDAQLHHSQDDYARRWYENCELRSVSLLRITPAAAHAEPAQN